MIVSQHMINGMRRMVWQWAIVFTIIVMLCGHVTELFDQWDRSLATGSDIDYSVVLIAACAGLAFIVAKCLMFLLRRRYTDAGSTRDLLPALLPTPAGTFDEGSSPPPLLPLRI